MTLTSFVNQTIPSKSGRPFDSQFPGSLISFQSAAISAAFGILQSGVPAPIRSGTGSAANGSFAGSALYAFRKLS